MPDVQRYVGRRFGAFEIAGHLGSGDDDERFLCEHLINRNEYVLRLDAGDARLWGPEPLLPPVNSAIEHDAATWFWELSYHEADTPEIYGVLDQRYLVAVSSPRRVRRAWPIDRFRHETRLDSGWLHRVSLYQDAMISMLKEAVLFDLTGEGDWDERWRLLTGGAYLTATVGERRHLIGAGVDTKRLMQRLAQRARPHEPELADNLLLRIAAGVLGSVVPGEVARATLRCPYFYRNVSYHELEQIEALLAAFSSPVAHESETLEQSKEILGLVLDQIRERPFTPSDQPGEFEWMPIDAQPPLDPYTLLLWGGAALAGGR
jgi:hypothetical protein